MCKVGFTGTQNGMTKAQKMKLAELIVTIDGKEFHHGDCVGADAEAHDIVRAAENYKIIIHPPKNSSKRAFKTGDRTEVEKEYIDRNHDIVDESEIMIATPKNFKEELRSGTWSTIRYARKKNVKLIIIYPDGEIE